MENQENNNLSELEQLKAQYETLKEQFDQQEIVNDRLMKSSIKQSKDFYKRYRWKQIILYPLFLILGLLVIKWRFDNNISVKLFFVSFCLVSFAIELGVLGILRLKTMENSDLLTLSNHARRFKKLFTLFNFLSAVPMLILVVGYLLSHVGEGVSVHSLRVFVLAICLFLMLFAISMTVGARRITRPCDEIIQKIEASDDKTDKKSDIDRRQRWLCITMVVVFLGLGFWAYTIVASYLKLPPMWQTIEYVRDSDDLTTEGKLEFWEVYADTLVAEEDVPVVMENWQRSDSLVVMRSDCQSGPVENRQGTSLLYALKKTSPEGPAISPAVLHGKPMVAYAVYTYPHRSSNTEPVPIFVFLTSEARQLWYRFTTEIAGHRAAIVMDGVVIQDWQVMCGIENGKFMITRDWSSIDEVKVFCKRLIQQ